MSRRTQESESSSYSSDDQTKILDKQPNTPTAPVKCTCGDCGLYTLCTNGCSKPGVCGVPVKSVRGIWNGTSRTDDWDESEFEYRTKCLSDAFAHLVKYTLTSFKKNKVELNHIIIWLKELEAYRPLTKESLPLLRDRIENISKPESVEQLFEILHHYWSWYNFHLLEKLIDEFGDENNSKELSEYLEKFRNFIEERKVLPNSQNSFRTGSTYGKGSNLLLIKVDQSWDRISIKQIWEFHHYIAEILKVEPHVLYLASIGKGCICLNFVVPETIAEHVFSLCTLKEEALLEAGVFRLEYREYVWQVCSVFSVFAF